MKDIFNLQNAHVNKFSNHITIPGFNKSERLASIQKEFILN